MLVGIEERVISFIRKEKEENGSCYASNKTFCDTLNLSERTLYRIMNRLQQRGLITRKTTSNGHYGKTRKIDV